MADDLGYGDLGCFGSETIETPHIDGLAADGLTFTDYHSNGAVCTPTRAALITGRYQQRSGLEGVIFVSGETRQTGLDPEEFSVAEALKSSGYATGVFGKWHLGYKKRFNPLHHGFDEFRGYVSGNVDYHSHVDNSGIPDWWHNL
ncbi:MAG: sulfatase-like hydrolase/transferase, partial [Planctomycetes bacterium]|nr:sulfatase-like hydrolase/transferase [Planctomycetota bacterium]